MCWMIWLRPSAWLAALSAAPRRDPAQGDRNLYLALWSALPAALRSVSALPVGAAGIKFRKTGDGTDRVNLSASRRALCCGAESRDGHHF